MQFVDPERMVARDVELIAVVTRSTPDKEACKHGLYTYRQSTISHMLRESSHSVYVNPSAIRSVAENCLST